MLFGCQTGQLCRCANPCHWRHPGSGPSIWQSSTPGPLEIERQYYAHAPQKPLAVLAAGRFPQSFCRTLQPIEGKFFRLPTSPLAGRNHQSPAANAAEHGEPIPQPELIPTPPPVGSTPKASQPTPPLPDTSDSLELVAPFPPVAESGRLIAPPPPVLADSLNTQNPPPAAAPAAGSSWLFSLPPLERTSLRLATQEIPWTPPQGPDGRTNRRNPSRP